MEGPDACHAQASWASLATCKMSHHFWLRGVVIGRTRQSQNIYGMPCKLSLTAEMSLCHTKLDIELQIHMSLCNVTHANGWMSLTNSGTAWG